MAWKSPSPERPPLPAELIREIRQLHFQTRKHVDEGVVGRYRSAFRGTGMEFEEVREYLPGDDIRRIDWKVTARSGRPFVKSYREERELIVMLAVDLSASTHTATRGQTRAKVLARVGAALTMIALRNSDKVGLVTFSDKIDSYYPARKARGSVWRILHEVLAERDFSHKGTNYEEVFSFIQNVLKRRAIVFLLTDGLGKMNNPALRSLAGRHDLTVVTVRDPADLTLPKAGLVRLTDPESGETQLIDTSNREVRERYELSAGKAAAETASYLNRYGAELLTVWTNKPFGAALRVYFEQRVRRKRTS